MQSNTDQTDPSGPKTGTYRVRRGGSCQTVIQVDWSAYRVCGGRYNRGCRLGFRVVLELTEEEFLRYAKQYRSG